MNTTRLQFLLDKYLDNTCWEAEIQELIELFRRAGNEPGIKKYLNSYWENISSEDYNSPFSQAEEDQWFQEIQSQAIAREGIPVSREYHSAMKKKPGLLSYSNKYSQWVKVAAILVTSVFLTLFYFTITEEEIIDEVAYEMKTTRPGEKIRFTLPDGTQVHLNSESSLEYPVAFGEEEREVRLEGEAYFVVARDKNRPFRVHTRDITTTVLGTSFNIRSYHDASDVQVAVSSGKVALSDPNNQDKGRQVILEADQWSSFTTETRSFSTGSNNVSALTAWNEGVLLYHDKSLNDVAVMLERWYGVSVAFDGNEIRDCVIRGEHRDETLVNVLNAISYAFEIEYHIDGRDVVLSGEGCN